MGKLDSVQNGIGITRRCFWPEKPDFELLFYYNMVDVTKKYRGIPRFEYDGRKFKVFLLLGTVREGGEKPGKGRGERAMKFLVPPR